MIDLTEEEIMKDWGVDNSDSPLVSVRCITYNHENYISQALDGFLMQKTNFPFEVIVHDDASTDRTADIIREYERKYPKIIKPIYQTENQYSKRDGSINRIMNAACKGKYIALCEGDDYWIDGNKLQMQVDFLEANPEYTISCHNALLLDDKNNKLCGEFNRKKLKNELSLKQVVMSWIIPTASMIIRSHVLKSIPKIVSLQSDYLFYLTALDLGKCHYLTDSLSIYRINNDNSVSASFRTDYYIFYKKQREQWYQLKCIYKKNRYLFLLKIFQIDILILYHWLKQNSKFFHYIISVRRKLYK